jgi:hypothetical protein
MSVEQVVDTYLTTAMQILGDQSSAPTDATVPAAVAQLPHPEWTGNAADSAADTTTALTEARRRLHSAAGDMAATTAAAAQIARDSTARLQGIITDWEATKAAAATTPSPLRDTALLEEGQRRIAEAMTLIAATTERYSAAAAAVRSTTTGLPGGTDPAPTPPAPETPDAHTDSAPPALPGTDLPEGTSVGIDPAVALGSDVAPPAAVPAAAFMPAPSAPMGAMPAAMPAMSAPMGALQSAGAPLSSLGGLASQLTAPRTPETTKPPEASARPGSVPAAINAALDALGITDPAARERWRAGYETLIYRESTNNPLAVNDSDDNARGVSQTDGAPAGSSRGLTQLTPENFRRYHLPGLSTNIYDPVSNIAASMRYVMDRHQVDPSAIDLTANVQQSNRLAPAKGY